MKSWRKHELVQGPADADLVFEIRYVSGLSDSQRCLSIVDPKTHLVLWPPHPAGAKLVSGNGSSKKI